jgi:histidyl-tRNA synthetase
MVADAEMVKTIDQIIESLDIGKYTIKVSNRKLLDAMIQIAGIDPSLFKTVCSSVDKLDKVKLEFFNFFSLVELG